MAGKMNATAAAAEPVRRAYVTFLPGADDGEGLKAVVRQAEDLRKVDAAYPLVVAVLPDVPESHRRILVLQGCVVREVEPVGYTEDAQVDEARRPWWGKMVPTFGSWLTTTAKLLSRQNLPTMAALAASSASMGVVTGGAANPAACFSYYVVFITAIAALIFCLRNI